MTTADQPTEPIRGLEVKLSPDFISVFVPGFGFYECTHSSFAAMTYPTARAQLDLDHLNLDPDLEGYVIRVMAAAMD